MADTKADRARRFVWEDDDVTIIPAPPGDNTAELYKDVDFNDEEDNNKSLEQVDKFVKKFGEKS